MLLHELTWCPSQLGCDFSAKDREVARVGIWEIFRNADGTGQYGIYHHQQRKRFARYMNLDAIEAQAVLYELLKE